MRVLRNRLYDLLQSRNQQQQQQQSNRTQTTLTNVTNNTNQQQHLRLILFKKSERNFLSSFCSILTIVILIVSLVETRWFYLNGGGCNMNYLGVRHFLVPGTLETTREQSRVSRMDIFTNNFILTNGAVLRNCATRDILIIMRLIIAFIFMAIVSSITSLVFESFGFMKSGIKSMRRNALFHIITVFLCLFINGFCFWASERMYEQQYLTRFKKGKRVDVNFDVSYYLIVLASVMSVLAAAFTLIRRYPTDEDEQLDRILQEYTGFDEPLSLERSLPSNNLTLNENESQREVDARQEAHSNNGQQHNLPSYIVPPATPPLQLRSICGQMSALSVTSEPPPPPYLDDDTQPLIV